MKQICQHCYYWHRHEGMPEGVAVCHRYPPVPMPSGQPMTPGTEATWWCGEWEARTSELDFVEVPDAD